jgi:transcriptional regulator with XRE-family HTH domain
MANLDEDKVFEFRVRLQDEFARRCRHNPRYSLRAFAKHSSLDPSTLSQILSGKRRVSEKMRAKLSERLNIPTSATAEPTLNEKYRLLQMDAVTAISDWQHFAILDLTLLKNFKSEIPWIARKLNLSLTEARTSVERLQRLGLLKTQNGKLVKAVSHFSNYAEGMTSLAHKEYQRQVITKALQAVDTCAQERKDITSITIAADSSKLKAAKEMIKTFRHKLCDFLEAGPGDAVYHLAIQLYPVTEQDQNTEKHHD